MRKLMVVTLRALSAIAATAVAAPVTVTFTGTVTSGLDSISAGDGMVGSFTYEQSTAPEVGPNPNSTVLHALTSLNFGIGSYVGSASQAPEIQIGNQDGGTELTDRFAVMSRASEGLSDSGLGALAILTLILRLDDPS